MSDEIRSTGMRHSVREVKLGKSLPAIHADIVGCVEREESGHSVRTPVLIRKGGKEGRKGM